MASATTAEGVKISEINLIHTRVHKPSRAPKFHIRIKFNEGAKTETSVVTEKKSPHASYDRLIWNESFSFVGDTNNSVITFEVHKIQWFSTRLTERLEKRVADLLQLRNESEFCKFDMNDGNGQLSFKIEPRSAILSDIVSNASNSSTHILTGHLISSTHDAFVKQENIWSSFMSQFQNFMTAVDGIAGIHPYAQLAWSILSVIPRTVITYNNRNDAVVELCQTLEEVYKFITDAKRLPQLDKTSTNVLSLLVRQTIECAYFVREYSKGDLAKRIWQGSNMDNKIRDFINKFDHLKKAMTEFVTLDTAIITLRVSETVEEIRNLHLLDDMPYARDSGFISKKRCLPGTRQKSIDEILGWVNNDTSEQILVLSGQAGTGKSAIAHTIAEIFQKQNRLGSLFCFNRSYKDRINYLFSTITRDLADGDVLWRKSLAGILDKTAIRRSTDPVTQFEELIVKPSNKTRTIGPVVIVIDALDESDDWREREPLLDILFGQLSALPANYRFIFTTRPEQDLESRCKGSTVLCKRMGDIPEKETLSDIQSYISSRLNSIGGILDEIQKDWSAVLAKRAEGLFQWAETACRAMDSLYHQPSLEEVWTACTSGPSASLYELYYNIISNQRELEYGLFIKDFKLIIGTIIIAREPLTMDALENIFVQDVKAVLRPFGSLLLGIHDPSIPVRPLYTSLLDFFQTRNRDAENKNEYYVDTSDQSIFTLGCLKLMNRMLRFNICSLETSHVRNRDVPDFVERLENAIPLHLSYACRFWAFHLRNCNDRQDFILPQLRTLMEEKILYLFEALGLMREVEKGHVGMRVMQIWCKAKDNELADRAGDAWWFGFDFGYAIEESTPHLYLSALPFTSTGSFISKQFLPTYPRLFGIEVGQQVDSPPKPGLMKKNSSSVTSLVFPLQGDYIATGFENGEFWFWDSESGEILYQWKARGDKPEFSIVSIVFSPDGQLVYCCFRDGHIRIWDVKTKEIFDDSLYDIPLGKCLDCTVSSDGCYVIFGVKKGLDYILVLCDRNSRQELTRFYTSFNPVFSPNGEMLAFRDRSDKVHLWNTRQQAFVHSWEKCWHAHYLGLSNRHIAFQRDFAIEVWDIHSLTRVSEFRVDINTTNAFTRIKMVFNYQICFIGHRHILFYSEKAYIIGDVSTGELLVQSSLPVGDVISSIAASPDSKRIVLGTQDTIRVGQLDTPIQNQGKTSNILSEYEIIRLWLRGRYLVQLHRGVWESEKYSLLVSDTVTVNTITFQVQLSSSHVAVSPRNDHVYVAYTTTRGLCIWSDSEGEFVLDESFVGPSSLWNVLSCESCVPKYSSHWNDCQSLEYSPRGDRIISCGERAVIKVWDVDSRALVGGPYMVPESLVCAIAFTATGESFVIAYKTLSYRFFVACRISQEMTFIEVRECQSGRLKNGPFKSNVALRHDTLSADETEILWISDTDIMTLDPLTGESEMFNPYTDTLPRRLYDVLSDGDLSLTGKREIFNPSHVALSYKLSPNRKYVGCLKNTHRLRLWDIDKRVLLQDLPIDGDWGTFFFSDDSNAMTTLCSIGNKYYLNIWDISTGEPFIKAIQLEVPEPYRKQLSFYGNHLVVSDQDIAKGWNLDVLRITSSLYERHKNHSQFGMFPADDLEIRKEIQTSNGLTSDEAEILEYALTAWHKALFSTTAEMSKDGWVLGPHGELLFWVPERRRRTLWRPCLTHIGAEDITKLNFDAFVHGYRWTECREKL